ncbi:MAG: cysteine--tRNA ligase [Synechococcaceae cyanobacterium ELA739]
MTLRLTNTLSRSKEDFVPLVDRRVSIYCCGVTVYDLCHLGHARSYIVWDVLRRYLSWPGQVGGAYAVKFVQNFTDIDDKILNRAAEQGLAMEEVSERNISAYFQDMDALNILRADAMPRATGCLDGICDLIADLERKGAAYSADGDVYFAVMKQAGYGKLSGRDLSEQQEGASGRTTGEEDARKHHPFDFALWKGAKPGEPSFPSPWGRGRPGWHIECSAMVRQELGDTIDIHLGGADLIFPHHENEIAQSEAASGKPLARYWLHNGMVNVGGEKMSKSLGNFTTIRALLESGVSPMTLRLFVLQAHYRKPLDFTLEGLDAAATGWKGLSGALAVGHTHADALGWGAVVPSAEREWPEDLRASRDSYREAMDDDLNTAAALGELFELARPLRALANRLRIGDAPSQVDQDLELRWQLLVELAGVLGLAAEREAAPASADGIGDDAPAGLADAAIEALVEQRQAAKAARDFATADRLRDKLKAQGIELVDKPGGVTVWLRG